MGRIIAKDLVLGDKLKQFIAEKRPQQIKITCGQLKEETDMLGLSLKKDYDYSYSMGNRPIVYTLEKENNLSHYMPPEISFFDGDEMVVDYAAAMVLSSQGSMAIEEFERKHFVPRDEMLVTDKITGVGLIYIPYVINQRTSKTWSVCWQWFEHLFSSFRKAVVVPKPIKIVKLSSLSKDSPIKLLAFESEAAEFSKLFK